LVYHAHIECRDVRAKLLFGIFSYIKIYFLDKESICTPDQKCISDERVDSWVNMNKDSRMLKKLKQFFACAAEQSLSLHKFSGKGTFCVVYVKR
jgi:hypothetical protein